MNKESIGCVIVVVLLVGFFVWTQYRNAEKQGVRERERTAEEESRKAEATRRNERVDQTIRDLAERHNAELNWSGKKLYYALDVQEALQKHGDRAIIIKCTADDVFKTDGGFRVISGYVDELAGYFDGLYRAMTLLLEVDETTARHLVEAQHVGSSFAAAVVVKRVTVTLRPKYHAQGETIEAGTYEFDQETEAEVVEGGLSPKLLITGKCLEIVPLED
jgi:hypothetical protein